MKKNILIVDKNNLNCRILSKILCEQYEISQVSSQKQALEFLQKGNIKFSLILLDIGMPTLTGIDFLKKANEEEILSSVPVIVETDSDDENIEVQCLNLGASDYIRKPFNPDIIKCRIASIIRLHESSETLNKIEHDLLTGIYTKEYFCVHARNVLNQNRDIDYDIICTNIVNFKFLNDTYGIEKGNDTISFFAKIIRDFCKSDEVFGHLDADRFVILTKHDACYGKRLKDYIKSLMNLCPVNNITVKLGCYCCVDKLLPVSSMCDRAGLVLEHIKDKYGVDVSEYDDNLRKNLLKEKRILDDMENGIDKKEFVVYYQPKHDIKTGKISGAEALVRWIHHDLGLIPPNNFIPLFEKNGFITKLDCYIWEEVCKYIHNRLINKKDIVPISVNVSRIDFEAFDLSIIFDNLIKKYNIDSRLIHLEVTESAYSKSPKRIIDTVKDLRAKGYKIEMDDFGSGYSSLNTLSDLPIDILKLDMKFVQTKSLTNHHSVLSFVAALAKWLNLDTVAEGVETSDQINCLKTIGINNVQGYFYSKPMPVNEFDEYFNKYQKTESAYVQNKYNLVNNKTDNKPSQRILIVEDMEISRQILKNMLGSKYNLVMKSNGKEALDYLTESFDKISIILLDLVMPVMDGFEFIKIVKNNKSFSNIPIIITSEIKEKGKQQALNLGANDFISKPYNNEIMLTKIKNVINENELSILKNKLNAQQVLLNKSPFYDELTECYNNDGLKRSLDNIPQNTTSALYKIDVDGMKKYNQKFGYSVGDYVLKTISSALKECIYDDDIIARTNGDEFVVIMKNISDRLLAQKKGNHLCQTVDNIKLPGCDFSLSCTIGISFLYNSKNFESSVLQADKALKVEKNIRRGSCRIYE